MIDERASGRASELGNVIGRCEADVADNIVAFSIDSRSRDGVSPAGLDQWLEVVGVVGDAANDDLAS